MGPEEQTVTLMRSNGNGSAFLALLDKINEDRAWVSRAACLGNDPSGDLFFPPAGKNSTQAKAMCAGCPVLAECRKASRDELFGVWAGTSIEERRDERRRSA